MLSRRHFLLATAASATGSWAIAAEPRVRDVKTISVVPRSVDELKMSHDSAKDFSAELIPEDQPFEMKTFSPFLTRRDELESQKRLPNTSIRRHALSVGLEMLGDDQRQLPALSREQILSYLRSNYVSIQARIYREPITKALYLGTRCLAATRLFRGGDLTQPFTPAVTDSVNNIRSLGLLLPQRTPPTPSNLRTLVLIHKNVLSKTGKIDMSSKMNYEYLFIRAQESTADTLELHAFATSDERTKLHWLNRSEAPLAPIDCSVRGAVNFTEYSHQGLYPKKAVVRRSMIIGRKTFGWDSIDRYSREHFGDSALDKLTMVLDAIVADEIPEEPQSFPRRNLPSRSLK